MIRHYSDRDRANSDTTVSTSTKPDGAREFRETVQQTRQRVRQAVHRGDLLRAIAILNRLIACHPTSAEDYNNRGLLLMRSGNSRKALLDFNRAIALDPTLPGPYNNRANYHVAQENRLKAIEDYDRAIDLDPFHVRARVNKAITQRELKRYDEALLGFDEALLFRQFDSEIYAERGRTYHLRGDWNSAIADYRRSLEGLATTKEPRTLRVEARQQKVLCWLNQLYAAA